MPIVLPDVKHKNRQGGGNQKSTARKTGSRKILKKRPTGERRWGVGDLKNLRRKRLGGKRRTGSSNSSHITRHNQRCPKKKKKVEGRRVGGKGRRT